MNEPKDFKLILIVDDDSDDRAFIQQALQHVAPERPIQSLEDGWALLEYLKLKCQDCEVLPALIVMDLNMPRKNGFEALREIKDDPRLKDVPVIIMSTSCLEEDRHLALRLGAEAFITKPASFQAYERIAEALQSLG